MSKRILSALVAGTIGSACLFLGLAQAELRPQSFKALRQKPVGQRPSATRVKGPSTAANKKPLTHQIADGITLNPAEILSPLSKNRLGFNLHAVTDITRPGLLSLLNSTHAGIVRWPGGSQSDLYHWKTHTMCDGWYPHPNSTFDQFMQAFVQPGQLQVAVTVNYGTNSTCDSGGDPSEAAAWVASAKSKNYRIKYWTVGNEVFGDWEKDLHANPHDSVTYAHEVANGYYPKMKAADPSVKVGIAVNPYDLSDPNGWTRTVLKQARYDFVEHHYYPLLNDTTQDADLLLKGVPDFRNQILALQQAMGLHKVPIMLGEFNNGSQPNRQTMSVTNALYAGMLLAESAELGLITAFPWELQEDYCTHDPAQGIQPSANFKPNLYGWQNFATYSAFSIGLPSQSAACRTGVPTIPFGTPFPIARTATLFGQFARTQGNMLKTDVSANFPLVKAYGASRGTGFGLLLFNLDQSVSVKVPIHVEAQPIHRAVKVFTYGQQQYDKSQLNQWVGPSKTQLGTLSSKFEVTLPPWSMSFVQIGS